MKVLVTGGTGFLGSHIAEALIADGHAVRALVRENSDTRFLSSLKGVEFVHGAVEDAPSVDRAMAGIEAVIHAAGLVKARSSEEFNRVNAGGTANLVAAARKTPGVKRFVLVSSLAAVGPSMDGRPVSGEGRASPVTHYGRSKLEAEHVALAAAASLPLTIIRPPMIYGPRDREALAFFKSVKTGLLPFLGDGKNTLSVVYGPDCARACVLALGKPVKSGSAYFVDDGKIYVWRDMLSEIERALGKKAFLRFSVPFAVLRAAATGNEWLARARNRSVMLTRDKVNELAAPHWVCDSEKAREELAWTPHVDWSAGVRETASWYQRQGWL